MLCVVMFGGVPR